MDDSDNFFPPVFKPQLMQSATCHPFPSLILFVLFKSQSVPKYLERGMKASKREAIGKNRLDIFYKSLFADYQTYSTT